MQRKRQRALLRKRKLRAVLSLEVPITSRPRRRLYMARPTWCDRTSIRRTRLRVADRRTRPEAPSGMVPPAPAISVPQIRLTRLLPRLPDIRAAADTTENSRNFFSGRTARESIASRFHLARPVWQSYIVALGERHSGVADNFLPVAADIAGRGVAHELGVFHAQAIHYCQHDHCRPQTAHGDALLAADIVKALGV
jgi:hypothetical protein